MTEEGKDEPPAIQFEPEPPPPTDEDLNRQYELDDASYQAKQLKALFANRLFVTPDGLHLRMNFGEKIEGESVYHTAFVVPHGDALEMGKLIVRIAEASIAQQDQNIRAYLAAERVLREEEERAQGKSDG